MGCAARSLTVWARACRDAGFDAGGRLELNLLLLPVVAAGAFTGLVTQAVGRRLVLRAPTVVRVPLRALLVVDTTAGLARWFFATRGTLDGHPGDSGLCPANNVPPRWPDWIPV